MSFLDMSCVRIDAESLYDPASLGIAVLPGVLLPGALESLVRACAGSPSLFRRVPEFAGPVRQDMATLYGRPGALPPELAPVEDLCAEYAAIHRIVGERAGFGGECNSVGIHHYPAGSAGISPHQDYASDRNLIGIFVLSGSAPFGACRDRHKAGAVEYAASPGSLILMRAARTDAEQPLRPFHYVPGPMQESRCTVIFRQSIAK